ncbi:MAG: hypothetical protein PHR78_04780 [Eubacteriales bacterium]|nr:hypothetical protein [Eubacteriales bacterium]MDD4324117.1 hypothetical protein [Eubacteriales bacterium]MDD4541456.1 hypothetical protein [Eubacteriales bacterium]
MIGKLYRLEMKETWRVAKVIYPLMIFATAAAVLLSLLNNAALTGISVFVSILALVVGSIIVTVQTVTNDYHNFQGKRGYLYRAIPAKSSDFLLSRLGYYLTYFVVTLVIFALLLMTILNSIMDIGVFSVVGNFLSQVLFANSWGILFSVYVLISIVISIFTFIFAITVGSEAKLHRLGAGGPVLVYFIYYLVGQVLGLLSALFIPLGVRMTVDPFSSAILNFELVNEGMFRSLLDSMGPNPDPNTAVIGLGVIFSQLLLTIVIAILTYRSFDKKFSLRA